jgi:mRNA-degrading endonuclease RelE of RelBE toxin-antitoxin system
LAARYRKIIDQRFLDDLKHIRDNKLLSGPSDWGLFKVQMQSEMENLDLDWEKLSRKTDYPPLSTYGYRKRYMHSIPVKIKQKRGWTDTSSDFRIVFKVDEEKKEIFYLGIGKRIKVLPKDPNDIWALLQNRKLPEEE